jgi:hypothetical protein
MNAKQWACHAHATSAGNDEILHFAGHGAYFGMHLADIAPHHRAQQMSRKADTSNDNGINAMI